jgi:hypothetical protein
MCFLKNVRLDTNAEILIILTSVVGYDIYNSLLHAIYPLNTSTLPLVSKIFSGSGKTQGAFRAQKFGDLRRGV